MGSELIHTVQQRQITQVMSSPRFAVFVMNRRVIIVFEDKDFTFVDKRNCIRCKCTNNLKVLRGRCFLAFSFVTEIKLLLQNDKSHRLKTSLPLFINI